MTEPTVKGTAAACVRTTCQGCDLQSRLLCIHTGKDLLDFILPVLVPFIPFMAGMIIGQFWIPILIWLALIALFFGYVEALILCRHCPHYAEDGFLLRCHANYGLPKIPRYDPRPLTRIEKNLWLLYAGVLAFYYLPFFILSGQWLLLSITTAGILSAAWTVQRTQCTRCYHLSCPANRVPDEVREAFYRCYPDFPPEKKPSP